LYPGALDVIPISKTGQAGHFIGWGRGFSARKTSRQACGMPSRRCLIYILKERMLSEVEAATRRNAIHVDDKLPFLRYEAAWADG